MTSISAENSALNITRVAFVQTSLHDSSYLTLYLSSISIKVADSFYRLTSASFFRALLFLRLKNSVYDIINDDMKKAITCVIGFFCFACFVDIGDHG